MSRASDGRLALEERIVQARLAPGPGGRWSDSSPLLIVLTTLLIGLPAQLIIGPLGQAGTPASVLGMCLFAWWSYARLVPGLGAKGSGQPLRVLVFILWLAILLAYLMGMFRAISPVEISSSDRGLLTVCAWSGILLVTADGVRTRGSLDNLLLYLVKAGTVLATLGIVQFFTGLNPAGAISIPGLSANHPFGETAERSSFARVQATASHPIEFGVVLTLILPLALHYAWAAAPNQRRRRWHSVLLIGTAIPMTVARSAILGLLIVMIVLFATWTGPRRLKVGLWLPVLLVAMRLAIPGLLGTIRSLFQNIQNDPSTLGRTADYDAAYYYFMHSPLLGRGPGTFIPGQYRVLDNAYLGWVLETGVLGLVALSSLMVAGVVGALYIRSRVPRHDEEARDLAASLAASLCSAIISFGTFDALGFTMCASTFFLLVGAVGALWRLQRSGDARYAIPLSSQTIVEPLRRTWHWPSMARAAVLLSLIGLAVLATESPLSAGVYSSSASVLIQAPTPPEHNPLLSSPNLDPASEVLLRSMAQPSVADGIRSAGGVATFTLAAGSGSLEPLTDNLGSGALIRIRTVADTPQDAVKTRDLVVAEVRNRLAALQAEAQIPPRVLLALTILTLPPEAGYEHGSSKRALACALVIAVMVYRALVRMPRRFLPLRSGPVTAR